MVVVGAGVITVCSCCDRRRSSIIINSNSSSCSSRSSSSISSCNENSLYNTDVQAKVITSYIRKSKYQRYKNTKYAVVFSGVLSALI